MLFGGTGVRHRTSELMWNGILASCDVIATRVSIGDTSESVAINIVEDWRGLVSCRGVRMGGYRRIWCLEWMRAYHGKTCETLLNIVEVLSILSKSLKSASLTPGDWWYVNLLPVCKCNRLLALKVLSTLASKSLWDRRDIEQREFHKLTGPLRKSQGHQLVLGGRRVFVVN